MVSPGINIQKSKFKNLLLKNNKRIITDLDLFFLRNEVKKSIVITGTNGKVYHLFFNKSYFKKII